MRTKIVSGQYEIQVLKTEAALLSVEAEWNALAADCASESLFTHFPFIVENWRRHATNPRNRLHIVLIWRNRRLIFAMPLVRKSDRFLTASFVWLDSMTPFYDDILQAPEADPEIVTDLVKRHFRSCRLVRKLKAGHVRDGSPASTLLRRLAADEKAHEPSYSCDLTSFPNWDDFLMGQSANLRQDYRRQLRVLEESGGVRIVVISEPDKMDEEIAWLFQQKREWARGRIGKNGWIFQPDSERHILATAKKYATSGGAFVLVLECGGARVASVFGYHNKTTIFLSKMTYDPAWRKRSPG
jgi:CelD/BcsL family acetyltransferase involved in cellulose biosynthesis